jgi:hypothetical protein
MRRGSGIAIVFVLVAAIACGVGWLAHRFCYPPSVVVARFRSPDGRLELVVIEKKPQGFMMGSPYVYTMTIEKDGKPLPGQALEGSNDSARLNPSTWTASWSDGKVDLIAPSTRLHVAAYVEGDRQRWESGAEPMPGPR